MALICSSKFDLADKTPNIDSHPTLIVLSSFSIEFPPTVCNEVPEEPVLSPVSNNVFERRLVVKFIEENGTDPINGEPLDVEQLLEIKGVLEVHL